MSHTQARRPGSEVHRSYPHRGNLGRGFGRFDRRKNIDIIRSPSPPRGEILGMIFQHELAEQLGVKEEAKITGCEYLASYNWLNKKAPTIIIPGRDKNHKSKLMA
jgi:hypothetical protein